jgi:hypothetical protein
MAFTPNNTYGKGRPLNSKNKLPDRESICNLIESILTDFQTKYESLTTAEKIKILEVFRNLYQPNYYQLDQLPADNEIRVTIIKPKEDE